MDSVEILHYLKFFVGSDYHFEVIPASDLAIIDFKKDKDTVLVVHVPIKHESYGHFIVFEVSCAKPVASRAIFERKYPLFIRDLDSTVGDIIYRDNQSYHKVPYEKAIIKKQLLFELLQYLESLSSHKNIFARQQVCDTSFTQFLTCVFLENFFTPKKTYAGEKQITFKELSRLFGILLNKNHFILKCALAQPISFINISLDLGGEIARIENTSRIIVLHKKSDGVKSQLSEQTESKVAVVLAKLKEKLEKLEKLKSVNNE